MTEYALLLSYFEKVYGNPLQEAQKEIILNAFSKRKYKKKEIIFRAGDTNTKHYYIEKGLLRLFLNDPDGKEFNILFAKERQWIGDLGTPAPTPYFLEALENSSVFFTDEKNFEKIIHSFPGFSKNIRKSYTFLQKRFVSILSKTAEENYDDLVEQNQELIQRLPQYHISSYLGVTPVFLSKILAKRARKKT
jgi:CRP-like cAMP-binding protein